MLVPPLGALPSLTECRGRVDAAGIGEAILDGAPGGAAGHIPQRVVYDDPRPRNVPKFVSFCSSVMHWPKMLATSGPAKKPGVEGELQAPTVAVFLLPGSLPVRLQAQEEG